MEPTYELRRPEDFTPIGRDEQIDQGIEIVKLLPEGSLIRSALLERLAEKAIVMSRKVGYFTSEKTE